MPSDNPTYDNVRLDLGIDPQDQHGHETRVQTVIAQHRPTVSLCATCGELIRLVTNKRRSTWAHSDRSLDKDHGAAWKEE